MTFAAAPDLTGTGRFVSPRDFIWDNDSPLDLDGHGTHVSGTVGQLTNNNVGVAGVAFNVRIMPVKCISSDWDVIFNAPFQGTDSLVARAIRYAADNGAQVINMSLGRFAPPPAPLVGEALRYAVGRGAFIAVSGGNDYEEGNPVEALADQAGPIDGAMVVAAVGPNRTRAFYSGVKPYIEIAAPGGQLARAERSGPPADLQPVDGRDFSCPAIAVRTAAVRHLRLPQPAGHVDGDAACVGPGRAALLAGPHQSGGDRGGDQALCHRSRPERPRRRIRRRPDQRARHPAWTGVDQVRAAWGRRLEWSITALLVAFVGDAAAQTPPPPPPARQRPSPPRDPSAEPTLSVQGYGSFGYQAFSASESFDAIFGNTGGFIYGGGVRVGHRSGFFGQVDVTRFKADGERVFIFDNDVFPLGIPLTVTYTPIEFTGGYRFVPRRRPGAGQQGFVIAPYGGGGIGFVQYKETSEFEDSSDAVDDSFTSYHIVGGADVPIWEWIGTGVDVGYRWVPDALGGGVAAEFDETDLGGFFFRVRITVGR